MDKLCFRSFTINSPAAWPRLGLLLRQIPLSAGQVSGALRRELAKCEWTRRMVALTRDFHVFASRVTTRFSAVFFSISHIAKAWYVRALFRLLIPH
jgi:hypothetical protein